MSWKLTIDVIFNSFPLIKKQKSDPFSLSLQAKRGNPVTSTPVIASKAKQSNDFKRFIASEAWQSSDFKLLIVSEAMISKGLWRKNSENQTFQGVYEHFNASTRSF